MSNTLIVLLSNSTGGTFKTCINMLGQYCTSKEERKAAEALTRYINYLCTDEGQTGENFIFTFCYSIMLL